MKIAYRLIANQRTFQPTSTVTTVETSNACLAQPTATPLKIQDNNDITPGPLHSPEPDLRDRPEPISPASGINPSQNHTQRRTPSSFTTDQPIPKNRRAYLVSSRFKRKEDRFGGDSEEVWL